MTDEDLPADVTKLPPGTPVFYVLAHPEHPGLYLPRAGKVVDPPPQGDCTLKGHVCVQTAQCSSPTEKHPMWRRIENVFTSKLACETACLQRRVDDERENVRRALAKLQAAKDAMGLLGAVPTGEDPT